ncbi:MAG TPA: hypothetical protein VFD13_10060 [Candidatus Kapabacteria bacterium]|nr:hypothetical protein [Candidatus Kapabacteria bacterium]
MIKYLIFCSALALCAGSASAQVWEVVNNNLPGDTVVFASNDSGYDFMGAELLRTSDSGKQFSSTAVSGFPSGALILNDVCWPTSQCGYMAYNVNSTTTLVRTNDAGRSVTKISAPSNLTFYSISFPSPAVGYATGENNGQLGYFVAKSIDSGKSWNVVKSLTLRTGEIHFKTPTNGIFIEYNSANVPQIYYTFDGMSSVHSTDTIPFISSGQQTDFINWNDDGSWIVQNQGIERSSDSGKTWNLVLPDADPQTSYGAIETVCFSGPRGFAFADNSNVFKTTDYGADWQDGPTTSPSATGVGSFSSMPSPTVAYVSGASADGSTNVLLKIDLPPLPINEVSPPLSENDFRAASNGSIISFTAAAAAEPRSIEILDVLGRKCASVPLAAMSTSSELANGKLRPGNYFARLGNQIVKFAVGQ